MGIWTIFCWVDLSLCSVQFSYSVQSWLCNHMDCSKPGLPVHHQLLQLTQTHVHWCHPTISSSVVPSPPAFNLSQHQGLFKWVSFSHQVAKVLDFQLQHQSFQWIFRTDLLWDGLVGSPCSPRDFQESSPTLQFKSISSLALRFLYSQILTSIHDYWKNHSFDYVCQSFIVGKVMSLLFNMLSRFVTAFLPRSKRLLILWLQSPSAVIVKMKMKVAQSYLTLCDPI